MVQPKFMPVSNEDMQKLNITQLDFVYVCGDAYVDHPSFGHAIIMRVLWQNGFTVGIIPQPDWHNSESIKILGKPRLGFLVSAGNIDSMVNHYTVNKKKRSDDMYSPGGKAGLRPDRATIVYCNLIRQAYKDVPIIIGGIEASLRRFAHYDYWDNKVRRSILFDSKADCLSYGMGERSIVELAKCLDSGYDISVSGVRGCCYNKKDLDEIDDYIEIPSFDDVAENKKSYAEATALEYKNQDAVTAKTLVQKHGDRYLVAMPPSEPLETEELDSVYELPYSFCPHPMYNKDGGVPAIEEVKFSITHNRGCFGECNFCALTFHQGRSVRARSSESVVREAIRMTKDPDFKGYIHDIGGPTANFSGVSCAKQLKSGTCINKRCLYPTPCKNLNADHSKYLKTLRAVRKLPGVKKVFIRSGIRYDYLLADKNDTFLKELCKYHVSGQLRVAPEHISDRVLSLMGKPPAKVYDRFVQKFDETSKKLGINQYTVPYLMSSHPGSTLDDAIDLAVYMKKHRINPKQVQDFYPTPFTVSTCMYYTGLNPLTMEKVYVPHDMEEKQMQRALLQFNDVANHALVIKALQKAQRHDLIGFSPECLVRPRILKNEKTQKTNTRKEVTKNELSDFRRKKSISKSKGSAKGKSGTIKRKRR
ncbi:MAG: YgiQ family radical SAM protein [Clostridia bacterium]|nr:YgiQ family radical SAM protein [Clostridia bacterium]